jgi:hypothetical protein
MKASRNGPKSIDLLQLLQGTQRLSSRPIDEPRGIGEKPGRIAKVTPQSNCCRGEPAVYVRV